MLQLFSSSDGGSVVPSRFFLSGAVRNCHFPVCAPSRGFNSASRRRDLAVESFGRKPSSRLRKKAHPGGRVGVLAWTTGEAESGGGIGRSVGKRASKRATPSGFLSASRVNCWVGRSAPDRQAPRTRHSSNCSKNVSRDTRCRLFSNAILSLHLRRFGC
jgi:hypothetical protein